MKDKLYSNYLKRDESLNLLLAYNFQLKLYILL